MQQLSVPFPNYFPEFSNQQPSLFSICEKTFHSFVVLPYWEHFYFDLFFPLIMHVLFPPLTIQNGEKRIFHPHAIRCWCIIRLRIFIEGWYIFSTFCPTRRLSLTPPDVSMKLLPHHTPERVLWVYHGVCVFVRNEWRMTVCTNGE